MSDFSGEPDQSIMRQEAEKYSKKLSKRGVSHSTFHEGNYFNFDIHGFTLKKPNKLRVELEVYGEVTRLYLAEEDATVRKRRKAAGGNGSKQFTEGWVEFADKKIAKQVAESLNNTAIGGKKRNFYHDDIWNIKYLKNFKWDNLTEKFAYERRVRENKLRAAMLQAKKQNSEFEEMVNKEKAYQHVNERKRKRGENIDGDSAGAETSRASSSAPVDKKLRREFKQIQPVGKGGELDRSRVSKKLVQSVFSAPES